MELNQYHAENVTYVAVQFRISSKSLNPEEVTKLLKIQPDDAAVRDDKCAGFGANPPLDQGYWSIGTSEKVKSKDINEHIKYLLNRLLPHREVIL